MNKMTSKTMYSLRNRIRLYIQVEHSLRNYKLDIILFQLIKQFILLILYLNIITL